MGKASWEDMTTNEKLSSLRSQIQDLRSAYNITARKIAELQRKAEGVERRDTTEGLEGRDTA
jgi:hypothetical protein